MTWSLIGWAIIGTVLLGLVGLTIWDRTQKKHAILRNFPIIGHLRYLLEKVGPELRQYIVTGNDEERPFSRDQRRWVYSSAKGENAYFGFGTDNYLDTPNYPFIRHAVFPYDATLDGPEGSVDLTDLPAAKVIGEWRNRPKAFRPASIVNISAMSFGALSPQAITALNRGAQLAGCMHNTGEGGISRYHRSGGDLIYQLGTGYFGARDGHGQFSIDRLLQPIDGVPVKAIEIKLSQGAKPGLGGVLPAAKVSAEIAAARGVPVGITVNSPARHREFGDVPEMVEFIEHLAEATGLPVGIKSAVGERGFWVQLADHMNETGRGPDFISIDGGEGGTGAGPLAFVDHVALPFRAGFAEVYRTFAARDMHQKIVWIGAGRLGFPADALVALSLGADMINVAREAMLAVGCIQAQKCHTDHCPTGVATQNPRLARGLDPTDKSVRVSMYIRELRKELNKLAHACGVSHPALLPDDVVEVVGEGDCLQSLWEAFGYDPAWQRLSVEQRSALVPTGLSPRGPSPSR
ncbi:MAG: FMN-binding glutamate synthase family protein [Actinomycetota bacterium]|nr:FMN-binding glutamate synthase family protein [Actinomycetota bacterium]